MATLIEFHQYFIQSILSDAEARGILKAESFFEMVCNDLISVGDLTNNYSQAAYVKRGMEVFGYDIDKERQILTLLSHQFYQDDEVQTLTKTEIEAKFKRLKNFFSKCIDGIYQELEETSEAFDMSYNIHKLWEKNEITKVRLMLLTDGKATRTLKSLSTEQYQGVPFDFRVIDVEYLSGIYNSRTEISQFDVEVDLPCLKVNTPNDFYQSYLTVIDGELLVKIYEDNGQKLFEQNVRTFLQFRGAVNKGLRNTIEFKPEMFFAFNNGITATATSITLSKNGNIKSIENLQIVNGGQTTSAIYAAHKNFGQDVSKISVQMKLSVVKEIEKQDEFISKVAEYANTQNKINNSDFFSNSPFHKDMKEFSKRVFAPAIGGTQRRTHWFYERVRGEYLNNQAYLKGSEKTTFLQDNPNEQVIDKTLLSKTENVWYQRPDIVSKGAQESFKKFVEHINEILERDNLAITESYFMDAISRVILFRKVERLITAAPWYDGGFRAQTVAYTISYLSWLIQKSGLYLNFKTIWNNQAIPESLADLLEIISEKVYESITQPPSGFANVTQWTKNSGCWTRVKELNIQLTIHDTNIFIDKTENKYIIKESKQVKRIDNGIEAQIFVHTANKKDWEKILYYHKNNKSQNKLNSTQSDILEKMAFGRIAIPSEKQSLILYTIYSNAKDEGLDLN